MVKNMSSERLSREEYFMKLAEIASLRGTCSKLKVGCILVKENRVIAVGYNGSPSGWSHCYHLIVNEKSHCKMTIHAELSVLLMCAKEGIPTNGCEMFITHYPCQECTKAIAQAGIKWVSYLYDYKNNENDFNDRILILKHERED